MLDESSIFHTTLKLEKTEQTFTIPLSSQPTRLVLDQEFDIFRRLDRDHIPPMLNQWVTDENHLLVIPGNNSSFGPTPFHQIVRRIASQSSPPDVRTTYPTRFRNESILAMAGPDQVASVRFMTQGCGKRLDIKQDRVTIYDEEFFGPGLAFLVSCLNPLYPAHVATVFYALSPEAAALVSPLLFYYGWDSYLVFQHGKVVDRGLFKPQTNHLEISLPIQ